MRHKRHEKRVTAIIKKFSEKYAVQVLSFANVGHHLHLQMRLGSRAAYRPFIRAVTGAIAMAVTRTSRKRQSKRKFWDQRPFTRIVQSFKEHLHLQTYLSVNRLESFGLSREQARLTLALNSS